MKKFVKVSFNGDGEAVVCPAEVASIVIKLSEVKRRI